MFLLLQTDYAKVLSDGWTAIRSAPFQIGGFLILYTVGVWLYVHRHYKHALEMEKQLKETYKEKSEANTAIVPKLQDENQRLKVFNRARADDLRTTQEQLTFNIEETFPIADNRSALFLFGGRVFVVSPGQPLANP
jgi:hypothetical protein